MIPIWAIPLVIQLATGVIDRAFDAFDGLDDETQSKVAKKTNKKATLVYPRKSVLK